MPDDKKPVKTETTVRTFNAADELIAETVTVVTTKAPSDDAPVPGAYL